MPSLTDYVHDKRIAPPDVIEDNEWDDENHDYLIHQGEVFAGRFEIKRRIGKARGMPQEGARGGHRW